MIKLPWKIDAGKEARLYPVLFFGKMTLICIIGQWKTPIISIVSLLHLVGMHRVKQAIN